MQCEFLNFGEIVQNSLDWSFHVDRITRQFGDVFDLNCFSTRHKHLFTRCEDAIVSLDGHNKMNGSHRFERTCVLERTSPFEPARPSEPASPFKPAWGFMSFDSMKATPRLKTKAGRTEATRTQGVRTEADLQSANHRDCELRLHPIESANGPPVRDASPLENVSPSELATSNRAVATINGSHPLVSNSV